MPRIKTKVQNKKGVTTIEDMLQLFNYGTTKVDLSGETKCIEIYVDNEKKYPSYVIEWRNKKLYIRCAGELLSDEIFVGSVSSNVVVLHRKSDIQCLK